MQEKFVHNKKQKWSSFLDTCVFAYNTSRYESSKFTPFQLMFGRRTTLPIDFETGGTAPEEKAKQYARAEEADPEEKFVNMEK